MGVTVQRSTVWQTKLLCKLSRTTPADELPFDFISLGMTTNGTIPAMPSKADLSSRLWHECLAFST
jgi:hypothetical protein